ncbi:MAG: ATPase [Firmicutes bacterium GWF2_51_9]|nr:MAG: ATPase [Firmicutes bacterium GWF2_51_9]OGS59519.1 MAG: ATPase [Firmicutes bacterium GWE2_51_13]HBZ41145.1 ATPase [Erysipelotrichaceae bacterium]
MKQLLILSGKGGTGKTTVASALIKLHQAKVCADCDVDAPNLHLVLSAGGERTKSDYFGLPKALIDQKDCIQCNRCMEVCRFDAITFDGRYRIDQNACEGCGVCEFVCPTKAVALYPSVNGELILYHGRETVFSTATLSMGSGNSGMLVSSVKKQMLSIPMETDLAIIDGSPGIGCPVIASLSGVDSVLVVAEPSISGFSDFTRILKTASIFQVPTLVCINKHDTNPNQSRRIKDYCEENGIPFVGMIPFDPMAVQIVNQGKTIVEIDCPSGNATREIYLKVLGLLFRREKS